MASLVKASGEGRLDDRHGYVVELKYLKRDQSSEALTSAGSKQPRTSYAAIWRTSH